MTFFLEIITPERLALRQDVDMVVVPTKAGHIGVLAHHVPLFSALTEGEVKITAGGKEMFLVIGGGFMEVTKTKVAILVSRAFHADELNEADIRKAQEAAKVALTQRMKGVERTQAMALLRRSVIEMKVLRRRRAPRSLSPKTEIPPS